MLLQGLVITRGSDSSSGLLGGAAVRVESDAELQVSHCRITGNVASKGHGGAFWIGERSILLLLWCILSHNKADRWVTFGQRSRDQRAGEEPSQELRA